MWTTWYDLLPPAFPSGRAGFIRAFWLGFFFWATMSDYGILAIASSIERSAKMMDEAARTSENRGVLIARAVFLVHLAGVFRSWVPHPPHTVVGEEDDIL